MKCFVLSAAILLLSTPALASWKMPDPTEGKRVFIEKGFQPPGMADFDVAQLEGRLSRLKYPFVVVVMEHLPHLTDAERSEALGDGYRLQGKELRAAFTLDQLAEKWNGSRRTSFFLLSYKPRQYRLLAAAEWKNKLGLEKAKLKPFAKPFLAAVQGTPKDPAGGIAAVAEGIDAWVFDQIDPARIEARQKAAAQQALSATIAEVQDLKDSEHLPASYQSQTADLLNRLKNVAEDNNWHHWQQVVQDTAAEKSAIHTVVATEKHESQMRALFTTLAWFLLMAFVVFLLLLLRRASTRMSKAKLEFTEQVLALQERIGATVQTFMKFEEIKDKFIGLEDCEGATKHALSHVEREINRRYVASQKYEELIAEMEAKVSTYFFFQYQKVIEAAHILTNNIVVESGETPFTLVEPILSVSVSDLDVKGQPHSLQEEVDRLVKAHDVRFAEESFVDPQIFASLEDRAAEAGIDLSWLPNHPLAGDDASDEAYLENLEKLKWSDPLTYMSRCESHRKADADVMEALVAILGKKDALAGLRKSVLGKSIPNTVLTEEDDPSEDIAAAQDIEARYLAFIRNPKGNTGLPLELAQEGCDRWRSAARKIEKARVAVQMAEGWLNGDAKESTLAAAWRECNTERTNALGETQHARKHHTGSDLRKLEAHLKAAPQEEGWARTHTERGKAALAEGNHVEAMREAEKALQLVHKATATWRSATSECSRLARWRSDIQSKLNKASALFEDYRSRVRRYSGSSAALEFRAQDISPTSPTDYGGLESQYQQMVSAWDSEARKAKRAYDAEQARIAAERRRRESERRREEARRRAAKRDSYNDWGGGSSSSGGGWGGGGSSSVGGGW